SDVAVVPAERLLEAEAQSILIAARDEGSPGRGADGGIRVALKEPHAFVRDPIDVRRFEIPPAVAADVGVPEIVRHDVDDVRWRVARLAECVVDGRGEGERTKRSGLEYLAAGHRPRASDV